MNNRTIEEPTPVGGLLSRRQLARQLNVHVSTTRRWERLPGFPAKLKHKMQRGRPVWTPTQLEGWIAYRDSVEDGDDD